jgi:hypothetical protein
VDVLSGLRVGLAQQYSSTSASVILSPQTNSRPAMRPSSQAIFSAAMRFMPSEASGRVVMRSLKKSNPSPKRKP